MIRLNLSMNHTPEIRENLERKTRLFFIDSNHDWHKAYITMIVSNVKLFYTINQLKLLGHFNVCVRNQKKKFYFLFNLVFSKKIYFLRKTFTYSYEIKCKLHSISTFFNFFHNQ